MEISEKNARIYEEYKSRTSTKFGRSVLPKTKRIIYYMIMEMEKNNRLWNVAIGGQRKVGKTVLLKQLAASIPDSMYLDLQYITSVEEAQGVFCGLAKDLEDKTVKLLLLDEVTKFPQYAEYLQDLLNHAEIVGGAVIFTSSSSFYLRQIAYRQLGARCTYVEMYHLSYYEFLYFKNPALTDKMFYCFKDIIKYTDVVLPGVKTFGSTEELFKEYLVYLSTFRLGGETTLEYLIGSYEDLVNSENSLGIVKMGSYMDEEDIQTVLELLFASQYRLLEKFKNKSKLLNSAQTYSREKKFISYVKEASINVVQGTRFQKLLTKLNKKTGKDLQIALQLLIQLGLITYVGSIDTVADYEDFRCDAREFLKGGVGRNADELLSLPYTSRDIRIYLSILDELCKMCDMVDITNALTGSLYGLIVEHYIIVQMQYVFDKKYSAKMNLRGISRAGEIDFIDPYEEILIEVSTRDKRTTELAFADEDFLQEYPELANYTKLFVGKITEDVPNKEYRKISYHEFGLITDACIIGEYMKHLS